MADSDPKQAAPDDVDAVPEVVPIQVIPKGSYRKVALEHYKNLCVVCGFGIPAVLEIAHLNQNRADNSVENLAVLCPNCHKMHDLGLIPTDIVRRLRDEHRSENWALRMKDAGAKAANTKKLKAVKVARSAGAKKAWATRVASKKPDAGV